MNNSNNLNALIFSQLSIYLIYNNSLESVLSLSLISKSTFQLFQKLIITHPLNNQLFIIPKITQFISYINHSNNTKEKDNYKYKLVQYKDIKEIKFNNINEAYEDEVIFSQLCKLELPLPTKKNNGKLTFKELLQIEQKKQQNDEGQDGGDGNRVLTRILKRYEQPYYEDQIISVENLYFNLSRIKSFLNLKCPQLKKVIIMGRMAPLKMIPFDSTFDGFYQINKLVMQWDYEDQPTDGKEENIANFSRRETTYSFKFLRYYSPIKVEIGTITISSDMSLELNEASLDNILSCKSIQSISHHDYISNENFVEKAISSQSPLIKSLHVEIFENINQFLVALKNSNFTKTNTTLKKLLIDDYCMKERVENAEESIGQLFEILKLNSSLNTLGLNYFRVNDHTLLSPLIEIKNINTIYTNSYGLETSLKHCNQNQNIKQLNLKINYDREDEEDEDIPIQLFLQFFQNNTSSLKTIKVDSYLKSELESSLLLLEMKNQLLLVPNIISPINSRRPQQREEECSNNN